MMTPRKKAEFDGRVTEKVRQEFGIANPMAAPRLEKIVVNVGVGRHVEGNRLDPNARDEVLETLTRITGQRPTVVAARRSVAGFKIRQGAEIAVRVTLRRARMWEFLDRLVTLAIPRIKDFRGLSPKSFDGKGNYSFGVTEQGIFPEINMAQARFTHGMHFNLVFKNSDDAKSEMVLRELGMPLASASEQKGRNAA